MINHEHNMKIKTVFIWSVLGETTLTFFMCITTVLFTQWHLKNSILRVLKYFEKIEVHILLGRIDFNSPKNN